MGRTGIRSLLASQVNQLAKLTITNRIPIVHDVPLKEDLQVYPFPDQFVLIHEASMSEGELQLFYNPMLHYSPETLST